MPDKTKTIVNPSEKRPESFDKFSPNIKRKDKYTMTDVITENKITVVIILLFFYIHTPR